MKDAIKKIISIVILGTLIMFIVLLGAGSIYDATDKNAIEVVKDTIPHDKNSDLAYWWVFMF
jgi:hypothetical protein